VCVCVCVCVSVLSLFFFISIRAPLSDTLRGRNEGRSRTCACVGVGVMVSRCCVSVRWGGNLARGADTSFRFLSVCLFLFVYLPVSFCLPAFFCLSLCPPLPFCLSVCLRKRHLPVDCTDRVCLNGNGRETKDMNAKEREMRVSTLSLSLDRSIG